METTKLIQEYLGGTLNEQERKLFEERLSSDIEFNKLYELHREVNESICDTKFHQFHSLVQQTGAAYFNALHESLTVNLPAKSPFRFKNLMHYAALFLLVIGTATIIKFTIFNAAKPDKLFDRYYSAYHADLVMRSTQSEQTALENAIADYNHEDYATALVKLNAAISENQGDHLAWFYKGLTCLALDQTPEAIRSFRVIAPDWNHPLMEHRDWYLALALLHNHNTEEAIAVFSKIRKFNGFYSERAGIILRKLGS